MVQCAVPSCKNDSRKQNKKKNDITFHRFPKSRELANKWMTAIRRSNWEPNLLSAVCSVHFNASSIFETKSGLRKLVEGAIPEVQFKDEAKERSVILPVREKMVGSSLSRSLSYPSTSDIGEPSTSETTVMPVKDENIIIRKLKFQIINLQEIAKRRRIRCNALYVQKYRLKKKIVSLSEKLTQLRKKQPKTQEHKDILELCDASATSSTKDHVQAIRHKIKPLVPGRNSSKKENPHNYILDISGKAYCYICLRTELDVRLMRPKHASSFALLLNISLFGDLRKRTVCNLCETMCLKAVRLHLALTNAVEMHNVISKLHTQKCGNLSPFLKKAAHSCSEKVQQFRNQTTLKQTEVLIVDSTQIQINPTKLSSQTKVTNNEQSAIVFPPYSPDNQTVIIDDDDDFETNPLEDQRIQEQERAIEAMWRSQLESDDEIVTPTAIQEALAEIQEQQKNEEQMMLQQKKEQQTMLQQKNEQQRMLQQKNQQQTMLQQKNQQQTMLQQKNQQQTMLQQKNQQQTMSQQKNQQQTTVQQTNKPTLETFEPPSIPHVLPKMLPIDKFLTTKNQYIASTLPGDNKLIVRTPDDTENCIIHNIIKVNVREYVPTLSCEIINGELLVHTPPSLFRVEPGTEIAQNKTTDKTQQNISPQNSGDAKKRVTIDTTDVDSILKNHLQKMTKNSANKRVCYEKRTVEVNKKQCGEPNVIQNEEPNDNPPIAVISAVQSISVEKNTVEDITKPVVKEPTLKSGKTDWEDKIPMDIISFVEPNHGMLINPH